MLMTEEDDWKSLTPGSLIDAVNHLRGRFEEEEFKFDFVTQQKCYKELHPVAAMEAAPRVFKHYMDVFEEGLKQAIKRGFDDLFEIGLANASLISQGPIEWAKSHLGLLITGKEYKIKIWIKNVCDQQEMSKGTTPEDMEEFVHWRTWRAPKLIIMRPSGNVPYDPDNTWLRATEEETEKFLDGLSKRFMQGLGLHLDRIAGDAQIKLAKQGKQLQRPAQELSVKTERAERAPDPNNPTPVVFISYSWDSDAHKQWVLDLATTLQAHGGVQIVLDRWHLPPGEDKTVFMEKSVGNSKFVILVCTPAYAMRANNREGGVGYEATIITSELAESINQRKFIPVLRDGDWKSSLPVWIKNKVGVDFRNDPYSEEQYQNLLRALHDAPLKPPPVGPKPVFEDTSAHQQSRAYAASSLPAPTPGAASLQRQRPFPNIVATGSHVARVSQVSEGVWSDRYPEQDAFIVQFTNEAKTDRQNVGGLVKAQLIYYDGVRELRRITGCWLYQAADMTEFRVDDTHSLMAGLMLGEQFFTVGKRRVGVALNTEEIPMDVTALHGFQQGAVYVRLTHASTGDVLYEGQFQLNTRPPEIIRK
jgi:hypothetical protein